MIKKDKNLGNCSQATGVGNVKTYRTSWPANLFKVSSLTSDPCFVISCVLLVLRFCCENRLFRPHFKNKIDIMLFEWGFAVNVMVKYD